MSYVTCKCGHRVSDSNSEAPEGLIFHYRALDRLLKQAVSESLDLYREMNSAGSPVRRADLEDPESPLSIEECMIDLVLSIVTEGGQRISECSACGTLIVQVKSGENKYVTFAKSDKSEVTGSIIVP